MFDINIKNSKAIVLAIQEIMDGGQLWITLGDDEYYIPELMKDVLEYVEIENYQVDTQNMS